jgi:quaternary ammonium compound-resistance protein SugE
MSEKQRHDVQHAASRRTASVSRLPIPAGSATIQACLDGTRTSAAYPATDKTLPRSDVSWLVLILSGLMEAVWATALDRSDGFSRPLPTAVFAVALALSMAGLAYAMRSIPLVTAYAVWVGIGTVLTVVAAMAFDGEPVSIARLALLGGIVLCVMGLKLLH